MEKLMNITLKNPKSKIKVSDAKKIKNGKIFFFTSGSEILKVKTNLVNNKNIFLSTGGCANVSFYNGLANYSTDCLSICSKNNNNNDTQFIFYYLLKNINLIQNMFKGSALEHLNKNSLFNLLVVLCNIKEQQKIASLLSTLDNLINNTNLKITKLNQLKSSLLNNMFG